MDSKLLRRALLMVTLFAIAMFFVVLLVNGVFTPKKSQNQDVFVEEPIADENGYIYGSDLSAWMYDEGFLDKELIGGGKYQSMMANQKDVVLNVSSVEKDLRIKILDEDGHLIKGKSFQVIISGGGKYKDSDQDGYIYVNNLTPGSYEIGLEEILGYNVPTQPVKYTVAANLEYKVIEDISYLIKTEADIDPLVEDTAVTDADEESSGISGMRSMEDAIFGIDVSKFNGEIDWNEVSKAGVKYAIIRCGYRGSQTGSIIMDPKFTDNIAAANEAKIPVGVYFFTQATNKIEAVEEASAVITMIRKYKITYPVFIDTEGAGGAGRADNLSVEDRTEVCKAFTETIRSAGYKAGIYASKNWLKNRLNTKSLNKDDIIWLAEYKDAPTYEGKYQMWQYSSAGSISGIQGRVDMNLSFVDYSK